ncbi:MAG: DUF1579 family protein [Planctomycetes bacterium]|nr:DUF1579 family protein [Planctomycetota bacterium]
MKTLIALFTAPALLLLLSLVPILSQDKGSTPEEEVEAWAKVHLPGDEHKMLTRYAGDWELEIALTFTPGSDPVKVKGASKLESAMGGRFLHESYDMKEGPMAHTGEIWLGFDNVKKKYQFSQLTSMDTGMKLFEGDYDAKTKKLTLVSKYTLAMGEQKIETTQRNIYHFESDDKFSLTIMSHYAGFPDMPEEGVKEVEVLYTRKK